MKKMDSCLKAPLAKRTKVVIFLASQLEPGYCPHSILQKQPHEELVQRGVAQAFQMRVGKFEATCPLNWISYADRTE
jgi:hypothetical protein